jgi:DNA-binding NtrC family response regulator
VVPLRFARGGKQIVAELPVILVVEDDQSLQALAEETLTDGGFEAAITPSGEDAVTLLTSNKGKYRALVTDINLSAKMDGWEVAQHAREIDPSFPVLYMSGAQAADWASKAYRTASCSQSRSRQLSW